MTALDVQAVAPRPDEREQRVEPRGADDRPVPVAHPDLAVAVDEEVVVADVGVDQGVAGRDLGEAGRELGGLLEVGEVRAGWPARGPSSRPARRSRRRRSRGRGPRAAGVSSCGDLLQHVEAGVQVGGPPGATPGRGRRRARARGRPSRRRATTAGGEPARCPGGAAACGPPRGRSRRTSRWALTDAAFTKCRDPSSQTRTEAKPGVKPGALRDRLHDGRAAPPLDQAHAGSGAGRATRAGARCGRRERGTSSSGHPRPDRSGGATP